MNLKLYELEKEEEIKIKYFMKFLLYKNYIIL